MASPDQRLPQNVPGDFYVDASCIDCGTCREVAPSSFSDGRGTSFVHAQPSGDSETHRARMALVACPVAAIGSVSRQPLQDARSAFPEHIDGGVYYCGYASSGSYGARSYLIVRAGGNILVDSPRYTGTLVKRLRVLGGVRWMFLTHKDDVADHRKFRDRFGCERILHRDDLTDDTRDVERVIEGDQPVPLNEEALIVPLPGHTAGSMGLLYRERFLFCGDHASWHAARREIVASREVCWYDWQQQVRSMERLQELHFEWLLPGHGRRGQAAVTEMRAALQRSVDRMHQGERITE